MGTACDLNWVEGVEAIYQCDESLLERVKLALTFSEFYLPGRVESRSEKAIQISFLS